MSFRTFQYFSIKSILKYYYEIYGHNGAAIERIKINSYELPYSTHRTGGGHMAPHRNLLVAPLKFDFCHIFLIGLKWSLDIFRKSQEI